MAFAIVNHYISTGPNHDKSDPRVSAPHRSIPQAMRAGFLLERSTGGSLRFVAMEGVDVAPHLIG